MNTETLNFKKLLGNTNHYRIPIFQRYYAWKQPNWEQLWDDILSAIEDAGKPHFMGTIVAIGDGGTPGSSLDVFDVIDGQQRLTTLSILCCALKNAAADAQSPESESEINDNFLMYPHPENGIKYKIHIRHRDHDNYRNLVDCGSADGEIGKAYKFFTKRIKEYVGDNKNASAKFDRIKKFIGGGFSFAVITLDRQENAYKIFKSLNSTGQDLSESDLIRNYVFSRIPSDKQKEFDERKWRPLENIFPGKNEGEMDGKKFTDFLRYVILCGGIPVRPDNVSSAFEEINPPDSIQPDNLADDLRKQAKLYTCIIGDTRHADADIAKHLCFIGDLDTGAVNPLLLRILKAHKANEIDKDVVIRCIKHAAGFIFRRYICGESSRAYANWFCALCRDMKTVDEREICKFLKDKKWPTDNQFKASFVHKKIYEGRYWWATLQSLEISKQKKERVSLEECQVEHVMPQTLSDEWKTVLGDTAETDHEKWLHTPGNLTIVGKDYNEEMSNKPYRCKKEYLQQKSKVYLNAYFRNINDWNIAEIEKRGESLANDAAKIWPGPPDLG